jgi:hypothetical protein
MISGVARPLATNVRGFAMVGLQGTNFQLITKIK